MIYVGSAEDTQYDQVLEEVDVGPIPIGVNKFVLTAGVTRCTERSWAGGAWVVETEVEGAGQDYCFAPAVYFFVLCPGEAPAAWS